jgi:four helix bundle protein
LKKSTGEGTTTAKGEDLMDRLITFGVTVLGLAATLPKTAPGRHIADQLMHSATSAAPNYAEARSGESLRDFVHKLGIVRKELHESYIWLRMLNQAGMGKPEQLGAILKECDELYRIISASKKTSETRLKKERIGLNEL